MQRLGRVARGNPFAKAAVEVALLDAWGRAAGVPMSALIGGGRMREELPVRWALSAEDVGAIREEVQAKKGAGHRAFKLKMGAVPAAEDIERVAAIAKAVGPECSLLVDPNGAWNEPTARRSVAALEEIGVDWIEQPVPAARPNAMTRLTGGRTRAAVLADESVCTPADAFDVARRHAADAVAVKVGKSGGPLAAQRVAATAAAGGLACYGGTALETSVGTAAALHLFSGIPRLEECELVGPALLNGHVATDPLVPKGGALRVPEGPGLGVEIDETALERFRP
jgi:muconate/chloromuconate cycloisomerase